MEDMRTFLVVDFEFTTYDRPVGRPRAFFSEIIEYAAVLVAPPAFESGQNQQGFIEPRFFPQYAQASQEFAMISSKDMETAISFESMLSQLSGLYTPGITYLTAWGDADWSVLSTACARYKTDNPFLEADYLDLAHQYRVHFGYPRTPSLKDAMAEQQVNTDGFWHTALADTLGTARLVESLYRQGWRPQPLPLNRRSF